MRDSAKTKEQLLIELKNCRGRISELQQSHEIHKSLLTSTPDCIVVYDMQGRTQYVNEAFETTFGWTMEDLSGKGVPYVPDSEKEATMACISCVVDQGGVACGFETKRRTKDGRLLDVSLSASRFNDHEGNPTGMVVFIRDITESKLIEKALQESEASYRAMFDSVNDAIFIHDIDTGRIIDVNRKMSEMYGYTTEEARELSVGDISFGQPPYSHDDALVWIRKAAEQGPQLFEWLCRDREGRLSWVEVNLKRATLRGEDRVVAVVRDISERKRTEEALRRSEELQRTILATSPVGIGLAKDRTMIWVNDAWTKILGFSKDDVGYLNSSVRELYPTQEEFDRAGEILYANLSTGRANEVDAKMRRKDGAVFDCHITMKAIDPSDLGKGTIATLMDITPRKRAENALKASEARSRLLVEQSPIGMAIVRNGSFVYVNPALATISAYDDPKELLGRPVEVLAAAEDSHAIRELFQDAVSARRLAPFSEVTGIRKNGEVFSMQVWPKEIDYLGEPALFVFFIDTSEEKRLKAELFQAQKRQAVGTLAGGIAHDFNNMLTIILGYSQLLLEDTKEGDPNRADLVERLLTFSRQTESQPRSLNLNDRIVEIRKLLSKTIPKMVEIELGLAPDLAQINADPAQIDQIVMNLALNASEAMPEGGKLTIETTNVILDDEFCRTHPGIKPGDYVLLSVSDTGGGVDKETAQLIFDPFFSTKERGARKGTGLGLAIVHGVVQQHGGYIECLSGPETGTVFNIYLPRLQPESSLKEARDESIPAGGSETILLVDDEDFIRDLGERYLTRAGYQVVGARDGREALAIYKRSGGDIDLVILDLVMPKMGGKQCLQQLLRIDPQVRVLVASGYSSGEGAGHNTEPGARGFVGKPFDMRRLLRAVRDILDAG